MSNHLQVIYYNTFDSWLINSLYKIKNESLTISNEIILIHIIYNILHNIPNIVLNENIDSYIDVYKVNKILHPIIFIYCNHQYIIRFILNNNQLILQGLGPSINIATLSISSIMDLILPTPINIEHPIPNLHFKFIHSIKYKIYTIFIHKLVFECYHPSHFAYHILDNVNNESDISILHNIIQYLTIKDLCHFQQILKPFYLSKSARSLCWTNNFKKGKVILFL